MASDIVFLTESDVKVLKDVIQRVKGDYINPRLRSGPSRLNEGAPDTYIAYTPQGGIPAPTTTNNVTTPGSAVCPVYQQEIRTGTLQAISGFTRPIYSLQSVPGNTWVVVTRDKFGIWWALVSSSETWAAVTIYGTTSYNFTPNPTGDNLQDFFPCYIQGGMDSTRVNLAFPNAGWCVPAATRPTPGDYVTPNQDLLYFGYFLGTTTTKPPNDNNSGLTQWPVFQLTWVPPFEYVTFASDPVPQQYYGLLQSEPNLILDGINILFGPPNRSTTPVLTPPPTQNAYTNLSIQYGGGPYGGATGTDGVGNMFVSGLCVVVGGQGGGGGGGTNDYGTFYT